MEINMKTTELTFSTAGRTDIIDITRMVSERVYEEGLKEGCVTLFVPGSTASITTIEYEKGVINDLREAIENLAPEDKYYRHNERWGDGNGHAHVRAALLGPSLNIPVIQGHLTLGTWQQIVFIDFDTHPRQRRIIMHMCGKMKRHGD